MAGTWTRRGVAALTATVCALAGAASAARATEDRTAGGAGSAAPAGQDRTDRRGLTKAQREVLREATQQFQDVRRALAAGYLPTEACTPGMGFHYAHPGRSGDRDIDPVRPEVLLYVPGRDGRPRLAGLEFFRADADGSLRTDQDRPTLFGNGFDGPMAGHPMPPGAPPMPVHYDLHVWLYMPNPDGVLATENPDVRCPRPHTRGHRTS